MSLRKIFKNRGFAINMLACAGFLLLAVFGWHLPGRDLLQFFLIGLLCLAMIVSVAFLAGLLLRKLLHKKD